MTTGTSPRGWTASRRSRRKGSILIRPLVYVAFFLEVGLLLIVVPWSAFWDHNYFAVRWPAIRPFLANSFVRGGVTGLGVVNLVAGFADLALLFSVRQRGDTSRQPTV